MAAASSGRFSQRDRRRRPSEAAHVAEIDEAVAPALQEIYEQARLNRAIRADLASPEPWLPERVAKTMRRRKPYS